MGNKNEPSANMRLLKAKANTELLRNVLCLLRSLLNIGFDGNRYGQQGEVIHFGEDCPEMLPVCVVSLESLEKSCVLYQEWRVGSFYVDFIILCYTSK